MKRTSTLLSLIAVVCSLSFAALPGVRAAQIDIIGPPGSGHFGTNVIVLPNGNFVVADPGYDAPGPINNVGAVYLYDGVTLAVISTLTGGTGGIVEARVGNGGVTVLSNGNYVVSSRDSFNGGAVTWGSGTTGVSGAVSSANSLVGQQVGYGGVTALSNGNYVVRSPNWNNTWGAATWGSGTTGVKGVVSAANSLVGTTAGSYVGSNVTALANGNYVVGSRWENGAGAVTWGSGTSGVSGAVSAANSLVGRTANDQVGNAGVTAGVIALNNGNYVVRSPYWEYGIAVTYAGAVTWGSGTTGVTGAVSAANSLVGSTAGDQVGRDLNDGSSGVTALNNGNYVVSSLNWDNGAATDAGAVTWGSGTSGVKGAVSAANSLVGSRAIDLVGLGVIALNNGNYVVRSPNWNNGGVTYAGAVTWGSGTSGVKGAVSAANSLVGSRANDRVGDAGVTALNNGNYVVRSPNWNNGAVTYAGAVTWGSGRSGVKGAVSAANSLVGSMAGDYVGIGAMTVLSNGNYVVSSYQWDNGAATDAGAVTWGSGTMGVKGAVTAANSLIGNAANDQAGNFGVTALNNGNYVVDSGGAFFQSGAVTWGSGTAGVSGLISAANSLVGTGRRLEPVPVVTALANGNYVVQNPGWDNGGLEPNAGFATWGSGTAGVSGVISAANSLVGRGGDRVGFGVRALNNGNYVVISFFWYGSRGAVTWGSGTIGVKGEVSAANSLIGIVANEPVGDGGVTALSNGNYVVSSTNWNGLRGAVTWGSGTTGVKGVVSAANSLVGSTRKDYVGGWGVTALNNGNYVVSSPSWNNGVAATIAGAMTLGDGPQGTRGAVTAANSVLGSVNGGGDLMNFAYDYFNSRLLVGYQKGNRVSLFTNPLVIVIALVPQGVRLRFSGVPGRSYTIERAPAVTGPWSTLNTQTVPPSDLIQLIEYLDTTPPAGQAFYRVRQP